MTHFTTPVGSHNIGPVTAEGIHVTSPSIRSCKLASLFLAVFLLVCLALGGCNARNTPVFSALDVKAEAAREAITAGRRAEQREMVRDLHDRRMVVERILAAAEDLMGTRYRYGGTSAAGIDCSGFVQTVFRELDYELPHSSRSQAQLGIPVSRDELRPGDLVFFDIRRSGRISHVGIYLGDGDVLHASVHTGVTIDNLSEEYYRVRYSAARRILRPEDQGGNGPGGEGTLMGDS